MFSFILVPGKNLFIFGLTLFVCTYSYGGTRFDESTAALGFLGKTPRMLLDMPKHLPVVVYRNM